MSYLNGTRFTFSGLFQANISTVNNYHENYKPSKHGTHKGGQNWNPNGDGLLGLRNCVITSAYNKDIPDTSLNDITVQSVDTPFKAAMVDLDNQQQHVSELWALRISIGPEDAPYLTGNYKAAAFADIWGRSLKYGPGAFYQSVLTEIQWADNIPSEVLSELQAIASQNGNMLSIKFNVDNFAHTNPDSDLNCTGRLVGTIGPYLSGEPKHFVNGRCLAPATNNTNFAYALIDESAKTLYLDMGDSLQYSKTNTVNDYGTLNLILQVESSSDITLGTIDYTTDSYANTAFVQAFDISHCLGTINNNPLIITSDGPGAAIAIKTILQEASNGHFIRADQFVFRMEANTPATDKPTTVDFYASKFGMPLSQTDISLAIAPNNYTTKEGPFSQGGDGEAGNPPLQTPRDAFSFASSVTTDSNGMSTATLTAGNPGNPRGYMDGQLYGIQYYIEGDTPPTTSTPSAYVNVHVYDECTCTSPTFYENVKPILDQYGWLYPVMGSYVDLANPSSLYSNKKQLKKVFSAHITSPIHMPITRDLSKTKATMLVKWIDDDCPEGTPPS